MSQVLVPMIFTSVPGAMPQPTAPRCASNAPTATGIPARKPVFFAHAAVSRPARDQPRDTRAQAATQFPSFGSSLRKEFRVGIAAPGFIPHRLVAGGANARGEFSGAIRAGQRGGNVIGQLHPRMRGVENLRRGPQAVKNLAEKPFAGIGAAAFGQILRADFFGQRGDFRRFGHAGVVLPQPGHGRGIFGEFLWKRQRLAVLRPRATACCRSCPRRCRRPARA
jgi:hypothetical protein